MEQKWKSRTYREGDEKGLFELYKRVYPESQDDIEKWLKWWQWKYNESPAGKSIIWVAEADGIIVGQYAVVPTLLKIGADIVHGAQSLDTMTDPKFRRQGIFENLAKGAFNEAKTKGINVIYGFPNEFSYPGFISKLGWNSMPRLQVLFKPFNWRNTIKRKINNTFLQTTLGSAAGLFFNKLLFRPQKPPQIDGLVVTRIRTFDERFDEFWPTISNQSNIMLVRNRGYLNWRYCSPQVEFSIFTAEKDRKICGYIVVQHKSQNGMKISNIFDVVAQSEEILHWLIFKAIDITKGESDLLLFSSISNNSYHKIFRRNGFIPLLFIKSGHFCLYSQVTSSSNDFLFNPKNWLVQIGDSDAA